MKRILQVIGEPVNVQSVIRRKNEIFVIENVEQTADFVSWTGDERSTAVLDGGTVLNNDILNFNATFKSNDKPVTPTPPDEPAAYFYTVNFYDYKGGELISTQQVKQGEDAIVPIVIPDREGYTFDGWDGVYTNIQKDTNIYGKWIEDKPDVPALPGNVKVYFLPSITAEAFDVQEIEKGGNATIPTGTPVRDGYTFAGWAGDIENVQADTNVYAVWEPISYTVTFKDYNGTTLSSATYKYNQLVDEPVLPIREGFAFTGWSPALTDTKRKVTASAEYVATYETCDDYLINVYDNAVNVKFYRQIDEQEPELISDTDYWHGETVNIPNTTLTGYNFIKCAPKIKDATLIATRDITYTLKYSTPLVRFFQYEGGPLLFSKHVRKGASVEMPTEYGERYNYKFVGWSGTATNVQDDIDIYGLWELDIKSGTVFTGVNHYKSSSLQIVGLNANEYGVVACVASNGRMTASIDGTSVPVIEFNMQSFVSAIENGQKFIDFQTNAGAVTSLYKYTVTDDVKRLACFGIGPDATTTEWVGGGSGFRTNSLYNIDLPGVNSDIVAFIRIYMPTFANVGWHFHVNNMAGVEVDINANNDGKIQLTDQLYYDANSSDEFIRRGELQPETTYTLYRVPGGGWTCLGVRAMTANDKTYFTESEYTTSLSAYSDGNNFDFWINTPDGPITATANITDLQDDGYSINADNSSYSAPISTSLENLKYTFTKDCILAIDDTVKSPKVFKTGETINIAYYSGCTFIEYK